MDLSESFHIWRRQGFLTSTLLFLALSGITAALIGLPRTYQSESSVILLASRSVAKLNGGNPYLSFSPSLTLTADALSRALMEPGVSRGVVAKNSSYTVALAPYTTTTTGSVLLVTVSGSTPAAVKRTLSGVTREISVKLGQLQGKVTRRNRIRVATLSATPEPVLSVSATARSLVAIAVPALLLALGIPVFVDGRSARRPIRRMDVPAGGAPDPADRLALDDRALAGQVGMPGPRSAASGSGQSGRVPT
jgi:hypothetical protein